jgi:hypothetical protein
MTAGVLALCVGAAVAGAQTRRRPVARPPAVTTVDAPVECPNTLGVGIATRRSFCDILTGTEPVAGAIVRVPPHRGTATLSFDLHNRHVYSAELEEAGRAYRRATATIGVLAMDGTLLGRAVVQTEFRTARDLFDRLSPGGGQPGVKAVAPIGSEPIAIEIPANVDAVSVLGEKAVVVRPDGTETIAGPGRPVAVISNVKLQYQPAPPPRRRR